MRPMIVRTACLGLGLVVAACIEPNRPRFVTDSMPDAPEEDAEGEVEEIGEDGAPLEVEVEVVDPGECVTNGDCGAAADPCVERVCVDRSCVSRAREEGASCDDGDRCTAEGQCRGGACVDAPPVVDGTSCDDDALVCNGVPTCQGGVCTIALPPACPPPDNPCASAMVCSEEGGGRCVDVPGEDGIACKGPSEVPDADLWQCSAGVCVPPDMVFVPGGVFQMGCPEPDYCDLDNQPAHEVRLSPFAIDRTEVSEGTFRRCRDDADGVGMRCRPRNAEGSSSLSAASDAMPVRFIDWSQAEAVCAYQGKRLCSEAEWEHAARGTGAAFYPWGNLPPTCARATFFEGGPGCGTGVPSEVGVKAQGASPFGVLDMSGNVLEWCADFYRSDVYADRAGTTPRDPIEGFSGSNGHVVRGGGFRDGVTPLRVFVRSAESSETQREDIGARCCVSLESP